MTLAIAGSDFTLMRWKNGFKLNRLTSLEGASAQNSLATILSQPFNVFFSNMDAAFYEINESTAETCGCDSPFDGLGKKARDFFNNRNADAVEKYNHEVLDTKRSTMHDYDLQRKDGSIKHVITFRSPLYDEPGQLIGLAGASICIGDHSLADSLKIIADIGFIIPKAHCREASQLMNRDTIDGVYLSSRERMCLQWAAKGKSMREIALILNLSRRTVEHYMENIKRKFNVNSKSALLERVHNIIIP